MARKAKFKVGQRVWHRVEERLVKILAAHFDPCDGWEYDTGERVGKCTLLTFEEDLRPCLVSGASANSLEAERQGKGER